MHILQTQIILKTMKKTTLKVQIGMAICLFLMLSKAFSQGMLYEIPLNEKTITSSI